MRYLMLLSLLGTTLTIPTSPETENFVPKDITKAVAMGCVVAGDTGPPPFAEVQVFVKTTKDNPNWDYKPKVARYVVEQGGVYKAVDECIEWWGNVKKALAEASKAAKEASK